MHETGLSVDLPAFVHLVAVFKCCLSLCELQKGSLSGSRNTCHYYSTHPCVEGFLVSPTDCLISGTAVGRTKGRSLNCSPGGRGCVLNVFCKLGAFLQFRVNWRYSVQVKKRPFIPREMNALDSKGINDSNVLIKKESKNIYFWKYGNWGVLLVGKERSPVGAENM